MKPVAYFIVPLVLYIESSKGDFQNITFYENYGCQGLGRNETFTDQHLWLKETWAFNAKSFEYVGAWRMTVTDHKFQNETTVATFTTYAPGLCLDSNLTYEDSQNTPEGVQKINVTEPFHVLKVERLGPLDMNTPQVLFFTEKDQGGVSITMDRDMSSFREGVFTMKSALQFANCGWMTFSKPAFVGEVYCFCTLGTFPNGTKVPRPFVTYDQEIQIGSGRKDHDGVSKCGTNSGRKESVPAIIVLLVMLTRFISAE